LSGEPGADTLVGVVRDLRIHGWGGESDVVYVPWTGSTYEVGAAAAEVLRHLMRAPGDGGCRHSELLVAFAGLLSEAELDHVLAELTTLHLLWKRPAPDTDAR
jgi:hypothetical protein